MVRFPLALIFVCLLAACGGAGSDTGTSRIEAERQARREADLQRERALTELARLQQQQREAEKKKQDAIEARRKAEAEARQLAEAKRQAELAQVIAEHEASLRAEEAKQPSFGMVASFEPWPDHSLPIHTGLGPWADEGLSAVVSDHAVFGVRQDGTPWIHGVVPDTSLYSNPEVRRTYDEYGYYTAEFSKVRWTGSLVGYTPDRQVVTGTVTLGDFDFSGRNYQDAWDPGKSRLTFSELQYQDTQATWGDGDLLYWVKMGTIRAGRVHPVHNNSFFYPYRQFDCGRSAQGCQEWSLSTGPGGEHWGPDAGVVRGLLLGPKHEAMAGTLQRDDLTAAFGGER